MLVLDANILIRAILGRRVRQLLDSYAGRGLSFCAPDSAYAEAEKYLPALLKKRGKSDADLAATLEDLRLLVKPINRDAYEHLEAEARERLRGRDEDDWPVLATALSFSCAIWTEDADFFGAGVAQWTSDRVEIFLRNQANNVEQDEG
jgi:predicted nucleic acid-binding protein